MKAVKATVFHPAGLNGQEILVRGTDVTELGKKQANKQTHKREVLEGRWNREESPASQRTRTGGRMASKEPGLPR